MTQARLPSPLIVNSGLGTVSINWVSIVVNCIAILFRPYSPPFPDSRESEWRRAEEALPHCCFVFTVYFVCVSEQLEHVLKLFSREQVKTYIMCKSRESSDWAIDSVSLIAPLFHPIVCPDKERNPDFLTQGGQACGAVTPQEVWYARWKLVNRCLS